MKANEKFISNHLHENQTNHPKDPPNLQWIPLLGSPRRWEITPYSPYKHLISNYKNVHLHAWEIKIMVNMK